MGKTNLRIKEANRLKLCQNCLQPGHNVGQCKKSNCRTCKKRHNSMLSIAEPEAAASVVGHIARKNIDQVFLFTVLIYEKHGSGKRQAVRVSLDQGSQSNFTKQTMQ